MCTFFLLIIALICLKFAVAQQFNQTLINEANELESQLTKDLVQIFNQLDLKKDGYIDLDEFLETDIEYMEDIVKKQQERQNALVAKESSQ